MTLGKEEFERRIAMLVEVDDLAHDLATVVVTMCAMITDMSKPFKVTEKSQAFIRAKAERYRTVKAAINAINELDRIQEKANAAAP